MKDKLRITIRSVVALVLAACFLAGYFAIRSAHDAPAGAIRVPRVAAAASAGVAAVRRHAMDARSVPSSQTGPVRAKASDEVEVCGIGFVKKTEKNQDGYETLVAAGNLEEMTRWLDVLADSPDERVRATALRSRAMLTPDESESARWMDRFVRMAVGTKDPAVYAMAVQACRNFDSNGSPAACQLISLQQWTRLDPDNAIPWLHLVEVAKLRRDAATQAEALHRASLASFVRGYEQVPVAALMNEDSSGLSPAQPLLLSVMVIGVQAAWTSPGIALHDACSAQAVADGNRYQTCGKLAELFAAHPDALFQLGMAGPVGRRVGWSTEKVDRLKSKGRALYTWMNRQSVGGGDGAFSCAAVERRRKFSAAAARLGETDALVEEIKASGASLDELIDQQVKSDQAIARKIELDVVNANSKPER